MKTIIIICIILINAESLSFGAERIDMGRIAQIESSGRENAINERTQAYGLHQITRPALQDYNRAHNTSYSLRDCLQADVSRKVADWYMNVKIPAYLAHYGLEDTIENRLHAYNMGIGALEAGRTCKETENYKQKYLTTE